MFSLYVQQLGEKNYFLKHLIVTDDLSIISLFMQFQHFDFDVLCYNLGLRRIS